MTIKTLGNDCFNVSGEFVVIPVAEYAKLRAYERRVAKLEEEKAELGQKISDLYRHVNKEPYDKDAFAAELAML